MTGRFDGDFDNFQAENARQRVTYADLEAEVWEARIDNNIYRKRNAELEKIDRAVGQVHEIFTRMGIDCGHIVDRAEAVEKKVNEAYIRGLEDCLIESIKKEVAGACMRGGIVAEAISDAIRKLIKSTKALEEL